MPRLRHGASITTKDFENARDALAKRTAEIPFAFAAAIPADLQHFDFLFLDLQSDPANLLPEARETRDSLIRLGQTLHDMGDTIIGDGDSQIPAAYTYLGQFVDHDVTLETVSATLPQLLDPNLAPRGLDDIRTAIRNLRTATLDLDSVYGLPAPRDPGDPAKMQVGIVTSLNGAQKPLLRPPGKGEDNDVPREPRGTDPEHDRAALIGDPRNDENTIVAQLHVAFLRAHNVLVDQGHTFDEARTLLRQHYQHIVLHDFLKRIADPQIVEDILQSGNRIYDAMVEPFFLPLEYAVAVYRFGHSMVRADYDFNLNFNRSREPGTTPATLDLLFTFTALSGGLGFNQGNNTLPDNWIIQWENLIGTSALKARKLDTKLVEPLFELKDLLGNLEPGDGARLAVRNLLRGSCCECLPDKQLLAPSRRSFMGYMKSRYLPPIR